MPPTSILGLLLCIKLLSKFVIISVICLGYYSTALLKPFLPFYLSLVKGLKKHWLLKGKISSWQRIIKMLCGKADSVNLNWRKPMRPLNVLPPGRTRPFWPVKRLKSNGPCPLKNLMTLKMNGKTHVRPLNILELNPPSPLWILTKSGKTSLSHVRFLFLMMLPSTKESLLEDHLPTTLPDVRFLKMRGSVRGQKKERCEESRKSLQGTRARITVLTSDLCCNGDKNLPAVGSI